MRGRRRLIVLVVVAILASVGNAARASLPAASTDEVLVAVATLPGGAPGADTVAALEALGLQVQPMRRLPMAIVAGTVDQLTAAVTAGVATDVHLNRALDWFSDDSVAATGADTVHADLGLTGAGVGVAIVDTGIDATHPALADHVTHNVKLVGPEYLNQTGLNIADPRMPPGSFAVPVDQGPYNNSDLGSGHGTHVAGIVAADATGNPDLLGMAPDAHLIGYSTGDVLFITTAVAAFDDILVHHEEWDIEVVNNSWGSSFGIFDPADPINLASQALVDTGLVVVFAAGNDSEPMTTNPYSVAPWVISTGSATVSRQRSDFSSRGIPHDDAQPAVLERPTSPLVAPDQHVHFEGDQLGLYHPDVSAPGSDIVSTGTPTGTLVLSNGDGTATASGTSMASPHVAGLAALLRQARPTLSPAEVRDVMQVTAVPMADGSAFWESGYGFIDARAAVDYVRAAGYSARRLARDQARLDVAVQGDRDFSVLSSDLWSFDALPATVGGLDGRQYTVEVGPETEAIQAFAAFPSTTLVGANFFEWSITLYDAAGAPVATSEVSDVAGLSSLFVDLRALETAPDYGPWTVDVAGLLGARDTNLLLGKAVTVELAELRGQQRVPRTSGPVFEPTGSLGLFATPSGADGPPSPEGCPTTDGAATGGLSPSAATACEAGLAGYATSYAPGATGSIFTSEPLADDVVVGGPGAVVAWLADSAEPLYSAALGGRLTYTLEAETAEGDVVPVASAELDLVNAPPTATRNEFAIDVPPTEVPAGARLRLILQISGVYTSTMRLIYGGQYDSGLALTTGVLR